MSVHVVLSESASICGDPRFFKLRSEAQAYVDGHALDCVINKAPSGKFMLVAENSYGVLYDAVGTFISYPFFESRKEAEAFSDTIEDQLFSYWIEVPYL